MTYVIAEPCIDVLDISCVSVCPVDCIHFDEGTDRKLFIDPNECIDCGACEPECPVNAIFPEESLPPEWANYTVDRRDLVHRQGRRPRRRRRAQAALTASRSSPQPRARGRSPEGASPSHAMRIVSLLPSATEIVCAIGLGDRAGRRHPRVRLPARGRRQAGRDPQRPRPGRGIVARHPPAASRPRSTAARRSTRSTRRRSPRPSRTSS